MGSERCIRDRVLPGEGAFPEIVETTHGGLLYDPLINGGLSESLDKMLSDPLKAKEMGMRGSQSVFRNYANEKLAQSLVDRILSPIYSN